MVILGIDPGLKATGYGFVKVKSGSPRLIEVGTIEPKKNQKFEKKIQKVYSILGKLAEKYKPDTLVLEKLYAHYRHPTTAAVMGHLRGVICLLCAVKNIPLEEYDVKRIRKSLTGNGNATKIQTQRVVARMLEIDEKNLTLDASDALALALGFAQMKIR